jgi:thiol-disulfide isomerase/thioredoxin
MATVGLVLVLASPPMLAQPSSSADHRATPRGAALERAFADFRAHDLDGRLVTAESLRGRVVLLDFWATWCAPCLAEIPTLQRVRRDHDPQKVEIVGISLDVLDRRGLVSWLKRQDIGWTQIHDRRAYNGDLARAFLVYGLPTSYLFDAEGRLVATNARGERLRKAIAGLTERGLVSR